MFKDLIIIIMTSVLVNNYVLTKFLGICPFLGVSKKTNQAFGMGVAVILVMVMATLVTWPIQMFLLEKFDLAYLQTIVFILVIAALVQLVEMFLKKAIPALHASLGIYHPLITTNCAVLGVCKNSLTEEMVLVNGNPSFLYAIIYAFASGLGFLLAMVLFSGVRGRMENNNCPACFKGLPITLIAAAILSCSFFGFAGVVDNIFG